VEVRRLGAQGSRKKGKFQSSEFQRVEIWGLGLELEHPETGRVLLRASGTEPLIRVMVEAAEMGQAQGWADRIARVVEKQLAV
jgi:phosphomannomutase